ncbi:MAG: hypothetical protein M0R80_14715 [Proteobacteria bacterium]|nr:hypothetical protein [Pseudomonadota bacterium]
MATLKIERGTEDDGRELEFELAFQRTLSFERRLAWMLEESDHILATLIANGKRTPSAIVKRPLR